MILKFISYQWGELGQSNPMHRCIFNLLKKHKIEYPFNFSNTEIEPEKIKLIPPSDKKPNPLDEQAKMLIQELADLTGRPFRGVESDLKHVRERLSETGVTFDGTLQMIRRQVKVWLNDPKMGKYCRPKTFFTQSNFNDYYASKDQPIPNQKEKPFGSESPASPYVPLIERLKGLKMGSPEYMRICREDARASQM